MVNKGGAIGAREEKSPDERAIGIAIIGTGFAGIGTAIRLKQQGRHDFLLFERAADVGGTWRDNTYPGCACDVESHLYSFSFEPNPRWTRLFSGGPEIWEYLKACVRRHGLESHLRLEHDVCEAAWQSDSGHWRIVTSRGTYTARVLVTATGALCEPKLAELPGLERFRGKVMHSARWDHHYDLTKKRVAVVGTGASAIQFVPEIQPRVERLFLYQRTPAWVVPSLDRPITPLERRLFRAFPLVQGVWRKKIYLTREALGFAFRYPWLMKRLESVARRHLERSVGDPELRRRLTPSYRMGCKRILISNRYYPALTRPNVELVTEGIDLVRERTIVTGDGVEREVDAILFATGFHVTEAPFAQRVRGREGRLLSEVWGESPRGYLGTMVPGFPNLFVLLGPNTGLGHNSVVLMIESQIRLVLEALDFLDRRGGGGKLALEPRAGSERSFVDEVDRQMRNTVWVTGGCASWYLDRTGRNSTLWPGSVGSFRRKLARFRPADYDTVRSGERSA